MNRSASGRSGIALAFAAAALLAAACAVAAPDDIHDIRGPKFVLSAWLVAALAAAGLLLAAAAYGLWRWLRARRRPRILLPFEAALERLEGIRPLMQPQRAREFSTAVSGIVRIYIEQRFEVTATHRTTEEFLHDLLDSSQASLARHRDLLSAFLHQCDLVKFAGLSLTEQSMAALHRSARAFVLETAKPEEPEAAVAPGRAPAPTPARTANPPPPQAAATPEAHDTLPST